MKICHLINNKSALGVYHNGIVININEALEIYPDETIPKSVEESIKAGDRALNQYVENLSYSKNETYIYKESECRFGPVVHSPEKIICVGLNYRKHADETGMPYPEVPILFSKFNNALAGHGEEIKIPKVTEKLDYEVELAIVVGGEGQDIAKEDALDYVFGYTTANDLSARDLQMRTVQWLLGKTSDGFAPVGPYITTSDEIENPGNLKIQALVNGELRQNSNTSDMIFNCQEIISYVSRHMTLKPGDIILTGTPEGVVMGRDEADRVYLREGDEVVVKIEGLGELRNRFV